jgi:uncharacterized protein YndB with AHSA1/START domain
MVKKILIGLAGLVVVLAALGFVLPDARHVERSAVINAPAEKVYALVADLNATDKWQPWAAMDPEMTQEITGAGIGQKQVWKSKKLGDGSQEIVGLNPPTGVDYSLDFGDMGRATAAIRLEPVAAGVKATWTLDTRMRDGVPIYMQPMSTYMGFFMDQMVGKDYEKGLAELKRLAEAS